MALPNFGSFLTRVFKSVALAEMLNKMLKKISVTVFIVNIYLVNKNNASFL
jgi:hypothetical protein